MTLNTPVYEQTRKAWRDIWIGTDFDRELRSLAYPRAQKVISLYLKYLRKDEPLLEAGCGPGHIVYYLREQGYQAIGLDYAPEALRATHAQHPTLPLQVGDVHVLPYAENTFGGYLSFGVVEHFEHGPRPVLREAFRVLKPGGVLVITVPHPQVVEALYKLKQRIVPADVPRAGYYERTYTHQELAAHVQNTGFSLAMVEPISHSYTLYGLLPIFRKRGGYYETSRLAEQAGAVCRRLLPWPTAFETLIIARKPINSPLP